jgi:hypothetical protein
MTQESKQSFVDDVIALLVKHFGIDRVTASLPKDSNTPAKGSGRQPRRGSSKANLHANPTVTSMLEQLRRTDKEKHRMLVDFYTQLKDSTVLREAQDIRHFAHRIGLKEIGGKSRKDMLPPLMRFLIEQPTERLQANIQAAPNISEQQRQKGFSLITDKLLGENSGNRSEVDSDSEHHLPPRTSVD